MVGFDPGTYGLRNPRLTTELPKLDTNLCVTKYVFIFNMASRTIRPSTCAIPQFQFWFKKTLSNQGSINRSLIKYIIKVVNVSKSQYYEFRHNIMNLGNQNSKYSWRIRDLENPQTGTHFANSVLMYKIMSLNDQKSIDRRIESHKVLIFSFSGLCMPVSTVHHSSFMILKGDIT